MPGRDYYDEHYYISQTENKSFKGMQMAYKVIAS